jgi:hypothetical protein
VTLLRRSGWAALTRPGPVPVTVTHVCQFSHWGPGGGLASIRRWRSLLLSQLRSKVSRGARGRRRALTLTHLLAAVGLTTASFHNCDTGVCSPDRVGIREVWLGGAVLVGATGGTGDSRFAEGGNRGDSPVALRGEAGGRGSVRL